MIDPHRILAAMLLPALICGTGAGRMNPAPAECAPQAIAWSTDFGSRVTVV